MKLENLALPFWFGTGLPGASEEEIRDAERRLGCRFPKELTNALMMQDGGVSAYSGFRRDDYYVPLPAFFSVQVILQAHRNAAEFGTPKGVVAIASGGHEWLGLDYRKSEEPSLVFQESEEDELEAVTDSFEELLGGLVED